MRALVTGGGGFLGKAIVLKLLERGWSVRSLARGSYPELDELGVETVRGDLADREVVDAAVADCDVVFHVAAKAGIWGPEKEYYEANVIGTANVLLACRAHGVPKLVYTSSPSVVHGGGEIAGGDESLPYPLHHEASYPRTKAAAEQMVLAANTNKLSTISLRPHLIWGPGDNHLAPRMIERQRQGRLRLVGDGTNLIDTVYIDNAADAHLLAADRVEPGAACAGKAYFITQGEPLPLAEWLNRILAAAGLPPVERRLSPGKAQFLAGVLETVFKVFHLPGEPPLTRFLASQLATAHWFDISAARRDLEYEPEVSIDEGFERLGAWFGAHKS
ncbi:MAG: NAD-dependent epimerase/dehydratase family protein [bacterium]|nr:NAD-dependent epimerase/dehydratase family protein [bacterium]